MNTHENVGLQVDVVISSPLKRALDTAQPIVELQALGGNPKPEMQTCELLTDRDWGTFQGRLVQEVGKSCFSDACLQSIVPLRRPRISEAGVPAPLAHPSRIPFCHGRLKNSRLAKPQWLVMPPWKVLPWNDLHSGLALPCWKSIRIAAPSRVAQCGSWVHLVTDVSLQSSLPSGGRSTDRHACMVSGGHQSRLSPS